MGFKYERGFRIWDGGSSRVGDDLKKSRLHQKSYRLARKWLLESRDNVRFKDNKEKLQVIIDELELISFSEGIIL